VLTGVNCKPEPSHLDENQKQENTANQEKFLPFSFNQEHRTANFIQDEQTNCGKQANGKAASDT
jgi:hypothetical protein